MTPAVREKGALAKDQLEKFMVEDVPMPAKPPRDASATRDKVKEAERLVEMGRLGTGCRILSKDTEVATVDNHVLTTLISKHPSGPTLPFGTNVGPDHGKGPTTEDVMTALESFDNDTAPGISGWTVRLLKQAAQSPSVTKFLVQLTGRGQSALGLHRVRARCVLVASRHSRRRTAGSVP